nr:unnamed protein product [Ananas comosus var. bracteatus]
MESSLLHAVKLLSKVFLQSLQDVSGESSFSKLWLGVLEHLESYMKARMRGRKMEKLQEAVPELLKNTLLVMKANGVLVKRSTSDGSSLWELTWPHVENIVPSLQLEVFPSNELEPETIDKQKELASWELVGATTASEGSSQAAV